jgi:hypothetical protein
MSVTQDLNDARLATTAEADDFAGRFGDDGGPSAALPEDTLRLLWASTTTQRIRGVWWPRGRNITIELATLLPAADAYLGGTLIRVSLNPQAWDHYPRALYAGTRVIRVAWFDSIDPATVGIGATALERVTVCIVPPEWTASAGRQLFRSLRDQPVWPAEPDQLLRRGGAAGTGALS